MSRRSVPAALALLAAACGGPDDSGVAPAGPPVFFQEAVWAPDGTWLLASRFEEGRYRLWRLPADGAEPVPLTEGPDCWASFSPDGTRIVYGSSASGSRELVVAAADGTGGVAITDDPARDAMPAWSPAGDVIAFCSDRDGAYRLWTVRPDGSDARRLGKGPGAEYNPVWSPDGGRIAYYETGADGIDRVRVMRADGTERREIGIGVFPAFSPDGTRLLYDRGDTLFVAAADGAGGETPVAVDAFAGRWSPDGARLSFVRGRWPSAEVWIANADGTGARALPRGTTPPEAPPEPPAP